MIAGETANIEEIVEDPKEPISEEAQMIAEDETVNVAKEASGTIDNIEIVNTVAIFRNSPNTSLGGYLYLVKNILK